MLPDRKNAVDGLRSRLYSRVNPPEVHPEERTALSQDAAPVARGWEKEKEPTPEAPQTLLMTQPPKKGMSFAAKFFIAALVFFIGTAGVAAYMFFLGSSSISPQNIDLEVIAPSVVDGGKQATFEVLINNRNKSALQLADLVINYPEGTRDPNNQTASLTHERQTIGGIAMGQQLRRTASAILYGREGEQQKVTVELQYTVPGSNAIFRRNAEVSYVVGSSPISISVDSPSEAIAGQPFDVAVTVQSNAPSAVNDVVLEAQYPFGFTAKSSSPSADVGATLWRLGSMDPGTSKVIHITGVIDGQDGDQRVFRFLAGSDSDTTDTHVPVPFLSVPQTLSVHRPFITATIAIDNQTGKSISIESGKPVSGTITWKNNLTDPIADAQLVLTLAGPVLDKSAVLSPNGFYQSLNNTITWSKDQVPELALVAPGAEGTLVFNFGTVSPGASGTLYTNPTIDFNLSVAGVRQGQDKVPENVASAASAQAVLASALAVTARASHFSGSLVGTGLMPPVANKKTSYAITWTVTNSSNTIANAVVSAVLPPYMSFLSSPSGSSVTYDAGSRTVSWALGDIKAGTGYSLGARSASFLVSLSASASQVGQSPALTGKTTLTGQDRFAQVKVSASAEAPTTALSGDTGYMDSMGAVVAN